MVASPLRRPRLAPPPAPRAPPLPPTQPPPPPESVADRLNARFVGAVLGSGKLSEIGVIMHAFDATEDPQAPWAPCPAGNVICGFLHDKVSASAVYLGKTNAYTVKYGGVVLHPSIARVKCGYVGDGGTREKTCSPNAASRCVSGCGIFASTRAILSTIRRRDSGTSFLSTATRRLSQKTAGAEATLGGQR